jgi:hypothetical protein
MRRTRKHNKKYRKTRKGGVHGTLKPLPLLPPSPQPTPPSSPVSSPNTRRPELGVENKNLVPIQKFTHPWYERQRVKVALKKASEPPLWRRLLGIKNKTPEKVPLNSYGQPIKSAFNINNKNRGFVTSSKP